MREKEPQFTVTDRRKFTAEGDLRGEEKLQDKGAQASSQVKSAEPPAAVTAAAANPPAPPPAEGEDTEAMPEPTKEESAQQSREYKASAQKLDDMLREVNPTAAGAVTFDRLVQSLYMTAAVQMGAGAAPNEQPRIDILGARQSIDMLSVLEEKTKGNLSEDEQRLLQNALFDLRMSFLEITNVIASSAQKPKTPGKSR